MLLPKLKETMRLHAFTICCLLLYISITIFFSPILAICDETFTLSDLEESIDAIMEKVTQDIRNK